MYKKIVNKSKDVIFLLFFFNNINGLFHNFKVTKSFSFFEKNKVIESNSYKFINENIMSN